VIKLYREQEWNYHLIVVPIILFLIVFFGWTIVSEVDEVVRGSGTVIPSGQTKIIQHLEGGIITKILVKEGDRVKELQPLYIVKNAKFKSELDQIKLEIMSLEAKKTRLKTLLEEGMELEFDKKLEQNIPEIIENERKIFKNDLLYQNEKIEILKKKKAQKEHRLTELKNKLSNLSIELKLARESLNMLQKLFDKGATSKREVLKELSKKQELVTKITGVKDELPRLKEEIEEINKKIELQKKEFKSKTLKELNEIEIKLKKDKEKQKADRERVIREKIVSPINGIVKKLYFYTEGGVIKPGDKVAEITPVEDSLTIEAKIKISDRALIWVGQKVEIEITAYDYSKYGMLKGVLAEISPDAFYDRKGNSFYIVKVKTDKFEFAPGLPVLPGMIANISILTGKKTIFEYILKPLKDIQKKALREK